jgi:cytochrome c553
MKQKSITLFAFLLMLISMQSCSTEDEYGSIENSTTGSSESHNAGQNCMNCHKPGADEAPVFKVAGTVYNEALTATNSNATLKLYTGPDGTGTLKYTLHADAKGNFYTTENVDFTGGLYPSVTGSTSTSSMSSSITTGACNSCHDGVSRSRVWIN